MIRFKFINKNKFAIALLLVLFAGLFVFAIAFNWNQTVKTVRWLKYTPLVEVEERIAIEIDKIKFDIQGIFVSNPSNLPELSIFIDPADLRRIDVIVKNIGVDGTLQSDSKKWLPTTVINESKEYSARIRIRGDQSTHWINKKKSWRLKFGKQDMFKRRRSINLIIPKDKFLEVEHSAYEIARKLGLLVPDSGFVLVNQNQVDMGLYFWIERLDKYFLERSEYPEGEIFSGDDNWLDNIQQHVLSSSNPKPYAFNPAAYKTQIHKKSEVGLAAQMKWHKFLELLEKENIGQIDANIGNFLNIKKFALWNSILFVFGNSHAQSQDNVKWYYDPTTGLFEPILYDVQLSSTLPAVLDQEFYNPVVKSILLSPKVRMQRLKALYKIVTEESKFILETLENNFRSIEPYLYRGVESVDMELSGVGSWTLKGLHYSFENRLGIIINNIENIKDWLLSQRVYVVSKYTPQASGGYLDIAITSQGAASPMLKALKIEPIGVFPEIKPEIKFTLYSPSGNQRVLDPEKNMDGVNEWTFFFHGEILGLPRFGNIVKEEGEPWILRVEFMNFSQENRITTNIPATVKMEFENTLTHKLIPDHLVRSTKVATEFPAGIIFNETKDSGKIYNQITAIEFPEGNLEKEVIAVLSDTKLPFKIENKNLILSSGRHELFNDLIIPKGFNLVLEAGSQLFLAPNVNILTFDSVLFSGTEQNPVIISQLELGSPWGVIGIVSAQNKSVLNHVIIRGGGAGTKTILAGIYFTGQLNFYSSEIEITDSIISDSQGEDGLNIKKSRFKIERTVFARNRSDGFDGDWVTGKISNSSVIDNGNDGFDFSGSNILINNTVFDGMGDKAISAGEQSKVDIVNCRITSSGYGITAKDLSIVRVYSGEIFNNRIALASYRKKPVFGGGVLEVYGGLVFKNENNFFLDAASSISLNGVGVSQATAINMVKHTDPRIGVIEDYYELDGFGNLVVIEGKNLPKEFISGPLTKGNSVLGEKLPNLSNYPLGLIQPLEFF